MAREEIGATLTTHRSGARLHGSCHRAENLGEVLLGNTKNHLAITERHLNSKCDRDSDLLDVYRSFVTPVSSARFSYLC